jgi:AraC-like DNA-binding protein
LLHDSPDTLDDSLTRTVLSLKETKSIDMDGAYSIFRKYAGILTEYAKTCAVPFDEDIQGSIKSISFIDTIEHCKTFIYERCRALSKTLKALPWQSMLVSKVGFIVELYYKDHNLYIPFICGMLGVGKSTLCDVYKAETGKTINEAIVQHRLEEACVLLRDSTLTIAEVSAETGFTDQNYFTRTFKHMFGVTPSIYRKRIIK